jgi:hypothetical protein
MSRGSREEGEEVIWLLSADVAVSGEFSTADALGSWVMPADASALRPYATPDFDGDGAKDLALYGGGYAHILPHGTQLAFGDELPARRLRYSDWNSEGGVGDFNNDGFDDLLLTDYAASGPPYWVNTWIVPGFEVPWEDDARC